MLKQRCAFAVFADGLEATSDTVTMRNVRSSAVPRPKTFEPSGVVFQRGYLWLRLFLTEGEAIGVAYLLAEAHA